MNSYCALFSFGSREELVDNRVRWRRTIEEIQIEMLDTMLREFLLVILGLVEAHDQGNTHLLEDRNVILGRERAIFVRRVQWAREGDELAGHSPVEVAILYLLVVLVLYNVELVVVVPVELDGEVKAVEAMLDGTLVRTGAHGRVSERREFMVIRLENLPGVTRRPLQDDDHESTHEEGSVRLLRVVKTGVMVNLVRAVLLVVDKLLELFAEQVHLAEIERAKVREERLVH